MKRSSVFTGKTEEAAIQAALVELGLDRDEVEVEILARAKSGFLGIGSQPAKIKVSYEAPDEEPEHEETEPVSAPEVPEAPAAEETVPAKQEKAPEAPVKQEEMPAAEGSCEEKIRTFLSGLLGHMNSRAEIRVERDEAGNYRVELVGEGLGGLIGRRGETLDAIQQLTNYAVNHGQSHRVRIHLDAENYRAKREESLQKLARKTAAKAVKTHRNVTLEPMNAYERHVIHTELQDYQGVTTYSVGTEPNRRLVVAYSRA